ncbi:hypothetical protein AQ860_13400 [Burkholderia pseudomallei]|nr:hypothetical protein AQ760_14830 [Burkholderia pseudomallei]OMZ18394.1 hypothetical protein AQ859_09570 [Burkholderia pseudomallei]OMZ35955.1 hypothetical protein AQ860_13400 [Burkholderia pseudomallei]
MLQRPRRQPAPLDQGRAALREPTVTAAATVGGNGGSKRKRQSGGSPFCLPPRVAKSPAGQAASAGCPAAVSPAV